MTFSYEGCAETDPAKVDKLITVEDGQVSVNLPIKFNLQKPTGEDGKERDQTLDAARHMRYAATLKLPEVQMRQLPRMGKAIIVGGGPSVADYLDKLKALAADPDNWIFAVNWSHTWLLEKGITPKGCLFFEIDAEPPTVLSRIHPDITYYICSHCHEKTFDMLAGYQRVLWHSIPNSPAEQVVADELFKDSAQLGGGIGTFTRTMTLALYLGFRNMELFGIDGSFPDDATSTHVEGYQTDNNIYKDTFYIYARHGDSNKVKRFKTVGYLALQTEELKEYCRVNHHHFALRIHGDGLNRFVHESTYPDQYK